MIRIVPCARLLLLALAVLPSLASAQDPQAVTPTTRLIPYTAALPDAGADGAAGARTITFALFDEAEGGTLLWSETQTVSVDARGRYAAHLGSVTALPLEIFRSEQARWLEVTVDGKAQPRTMLVAVPYALRAADAETLGGKPVSAFMLNREGRRPIFDAPALDGTGLAGTFALWTDADTVSNSILWQVGNRISIFTADPTEGGQLDARFMMRSNDGATAIGVANQVGVPRFALNTNADGSWVIYDRATGSYEPGIAQKGGRVGISTTDPLGGGVVESKLTVRNLDNNTGIAVLNQSDARRFALNTQANGGWQMFDGGGGTWNLGLRQLGGKVGLGSAPLAKFEVSETGTNEAGFFTISNAASPQEALVGQTNGTGPALRGNSTNAAGLAVLASVSAAAANLFIGRVGVANVFRVDGAGEVFAAVYNTGGADFAEAVDAVAGVDAYEPGDVMVIAEGQDRSVDRASEPYARTVIGIYSTKPGILASPYPVDDPRRAGKLPLAMIGIVPCKVSAENGAIARGDLLVTSSTPGHAMRGTDLTRMTGAIVGKALEPLANGKGVILVAVTLQ
jgi:hypothetical protein